MRGPVSQLRRVAAKLFNIEVLSHLKCQVTREDGEHDPRNKNVHFYVLFCFWIRFMSHRLEFKSEVGQGLGMTTRSIETFLSLYLFKVKVVVMLRFTTGEGGGD